MAVVPLKGKPITDVSAPETLSPNPTSRPILNNHAVMTTDPMVVNNTNGTDGEEKPSGIVNHQAKTIAPIGSIADQSDTEVAEPESVSATKAVPEESAVVPDEPESESLADDDARAASNKKDAKKSVDADVKRQAELEALIEKGTYVVPINASKRQHVHMLVMWLVLGLVLVLGIAAVGYFYGSKLGLPPSLPFKK